MTTDNIYKTLEGVGGFHFSVTRRELKTMGRAELVRWLEHRGVACYDDESTEDLRECALIDFDGE